MAYLYLYKTEDPAPPFPLAGDAIPNEPLLAVGLKAYPLNDGLALVLLVPDPLNVNISNLIKCKIISKNI